MIKAESNNYKKQHMHFEINDNTTIRHIQERFSDYYPYLQIEFYKKPHKKYEASEDKDLLFPGKTIGEVKQTHVSALMEIKPDSKVAEIEKEFMQRFGLSVQILKKEKEFTNLKKFAEVFIRQTQYILNQYRRGRVWRHFL